MKDSQPGKLWDSTVCKYIKESNERFSTDFSKRALTGLSISRRVMKDSQPARRILASLRKYIKESNERFSTRLFHSLLPT